MTAPSVRDAVPGDWPAVRRLLTAAELPTADLAATSMHAFVVASAGEAVIGAGGLDVLGTQALLRSLVVEPSWSRGGIGRQLVAALEARARHRGVEQIWLLTIDASDYFLGRGYVVRGRENVPDAVRATREFSALCPDTAIVMSRRPPEI